MLNLWIKRAVFAVLLPVFFTTAATAVFAADPMVSIYRDFDDGLFGRSLYRGVIFSVKLESFSRYKTLPVKDFDGLTAYLVSKDRAEYLEAGLGHGISIRDGAEKTYSYDKDGISISFELEKAPPDLYDEIGRTYNRLLSDSEYARRVIREVSSSYKSGFIIRISRAENVYRPQFSGIDYEDILISAALIADTFQPLWGIHDGNDITAAAE